MKNLTIDIILGIDFLYLWKAKLDLRKLVVQLNGKFVNIAQFYEDSEEKKLHIQNNVYQIILKVTGLSIQIADQTTHPRHTSNLLRF